MNTKIELNTLASNGYPMEVALTETARLGVKFIEPVYISKYYPELQESYFTKNNAMSLLQQVKNSGLKVKSVASIWTWDCPVGGLSEGVVDYKHLFQQFPKLTRLPMSIELPVRFGYNEKFDFVMLDNGQKPTLEEQHNVLNDSLIWLKSITKN